MTQRFISIGSSAFFKNVDIDSSLNGSNQLVVTLTTTDKMLSYRRETALQGALQFSPKVED